MAKQAYAPEPGLVDDFIEFECPGLVQQGDGRFILTGVKRVNIDWSAVGEVFAAAGIDDDVLLEKVARMAERHLLAEALAKRIR
jgi:hypothetical protein